MVDYSSCSVDQFRSLFSAEIGRYLTPFVGFPFDERGSVAVFFQPLLGAFYVTIEFFAFIVAWKFCLAFLAFYPQ